MSNMGRLMQAAEGAFGGVWSLGEVAVMAARIQELRHDPHRDAVLSDIAERGFYVPIPAPQPLRSRSGGWLTGRNPYQRIGDGVPDRIVAKMIPARSGKKAKDLVIVCHCYGVPVPFLMERLFGLHSAEHTDVVYNIMNHHYAGSFPAWPGTGFASGRLSHFLENIRSAITGVRALVESLAAENQYERITAIGFSIGGQLAFHLANSAPITQAILYAPVTSLHATAGELGFMGRLQRPFEQVLRSFNRGFVIDDLKLADPLRYRLGIAEEDLHVIVQRYDALAPMHQIEHIKVQYPKAGWHEFEGTHIYPAGMPQFQSVIRELI